MERLDSLEAVGRAQEYIEGHLREKITMGGLARAAGYSQWHTARMFKEHTGRTPFDYIRARRLAGAALRLRDGGERVLDVALDFTFDSNEGFTRAFTRQFGVSPGAYARTTPPIPLFLPENVVASYRALNRKDVIPMEKPTKTIFAQVIERPARRLLVKRGVNATHYFEYCEEVGCDVWGVLCSVKEALYEPVGMWLPKGMIPEGTSEYVQGVEVPADYVKKPPEGFELVDLPPATYMVFQGEPYEDDEAFSEAIGEVWRHLETFNPALYGYQWDPEAAPRFQLAPMGYRGYIEGRPVKKA